MLLKSKSSLDVQCSSQWSKASTVIQIFLFILYRHDCLGQLFIESDRMPKIKRNCFGWFPPKQKKAQYSPEKERQRERGGGRGRGERDRSNHPTQFEILPKSDLIKNQPLTYSPAEFFYARYFLFVVFQFKEARKEKRRRKKNILNFF